MLTKKEKQLIINALQNEINALELQLLICYKAKTKMIAEKIHEKIQIQKEIQKKLESEIN